MDKIPKDRVYQLKLNDGMMLFVPEEIYKRMMEEKDGS